MRLQGNNLL